MPADDIRTALEAAFPGREVKGHGDDAIVTVDIIIPDRMRFVVELSEKIVDPDFDDDDTPGFFVAIGSEELTVCADGPTPEHALALLWKRVTALRQALDEIPQPVLASDRGKG